MRQTVLYRLETRVRDGSRTWERALILSLRRPMLLWFLLAGGLLVVKILGIPEVADHLAYPSYIHGSGHVGGRVHPSRLVNRRSPSTSYPLKSMNELAHRSSLEPARPGPVAFVGLLGRCPTDALQQAATFARELGAVLHVLQLTPPAGAGMPHDFELLLEEARAKTRLLRRAQAWCRRTLRGTHYQLCVFDDGCDGGFDDALVSYARRQAPELVILAPYENGARGRAAAIARRTGMPVLVARPHGRTHAAVVATDLGDRSNPVSRRADELLLADPRSRH